MQVLARSWLGFQLQVRNCFFLGSQIGLHIRIMRISSKKGQPALNIHSVPALIFPAILSCLQPCSNPFLPTLSYHLTIPTRLPTCPHISHVVDTVYWLISTLSVPDCLVCIRPNIPAFVLDDPWTDDSTQLLSG